MFCRLEIISKSASESPGLVRTVARGTLISGHNSAIPMLTTNVCSDVTFFCRTVPLKMALSPFAGSFAKSISSPNPISIAIR